ncbi:glycoside hydrolase family 61 protein [Bipolaris maydis ATCC 48331]|uniref:AA9 family lytic polysaccharide monooxygenase n=3 Tax=Cochliobolus heterostrophus TaxID=5016 RepID=M2UNN9_COCH5|nr:glycoside hydrolase family 61 protein [Bipolaris maydis ATCC 48331]EMD89537.1 glycoside hydrolase family 61 protein [Bipolaris maydis C5]KAJ5025734.1 glycoside hydrolase [Bipolaris maydis]ENI10248.1 glycoside hydrolase family 61 protein [Bipolaris maydis ATCC 48331]KAJ5064347.1 glycoside hydrolase [Bipolaris maydis]KAJ6196507.1 glycoside hydrolase [Bipolaris maydis]
MRISTPLVLTAVASSTTAHTIFLSLNGGAVGDGVRVPTYDGPISDVTTNSIACNGPPNDVPAKTNTVITVQAGSKATLTWRHTLTSGPNDVVDASHKGPVMAYMKKVTDAKTDSGVGGGWFKIAQDAFDGSKWGVDRLIANQGNQTVTIPACIAPGQYLLRGELIALHAASQLLGAQFYMECAQINVVGGSASKTPATVSFPGAYKQDDAGIVYNLYAGLKNYTAPGPDVFTC